MAVKKVQGEMESALKQLQPWRADTWGFGSYLYRFRMDVWDQIGNRWDEVYASMPVEFSVQVHIRKTGMTREPIHVAH